MFVLQLKRILKKDSGKKTENTEIQGATQEQTELQTDFIRGP